MVRTHLTAINSIDLTHLLFNKRVTRLTLHRFTTSCLDDIERIPGHAWIMNDLAAGILLENTLGQQPDNVITLDERAILIEQKTTIKIPIPGNTQIGIMFNNSLGGYRLILFQHRIGNAVGKRTIGLVMDFYQPKRPHNHYQR